MTAVGLRCGGEKPAAVLRLVYTFGWVPALICAYLVRPGFAAPAALSGAGALGIRAGTGLVFTLAILTAAYAAALRRPPNSRELSVAAAGSLLAALAMPLLFSADVYAYAFYGDLALHGRDPYGHDPALVSDAVSRAAAGAWDGHIPPRCVYGPVAVALAALADAIGAPGGVAAQILAQRLAAVAAYATVIALSLRLVRDPRARAAMLLNPVVIWSVAEGHNDAAMLACVLAGLCAARARARSLWFAAGTLVKAPALVVWPQLKRGRDRLLAAALVGAGYLPLAVAYTSDMRRGSSPLTPATVWDSPLGLASMVAGRLPAAVLGVTLLFVAAGAARRLAAAERVPAFALAAWFALPNAYPWYALWIVPLAARNLPSIWSRALLVAALLAPARALTDAITGPAEHASAGPHPAMIALAYLPPLASLAWGKLSRRGTAALAVLAVLAVTAAPAGRALAQSTAPSPLPAAPPATPGNATPAPAGTPPNAAAQPAPFPSPTPSGPGAPTSTAAPSPTISALPAPGVPSPAIVPSPTLAPPPTPAPSPAPVAPSPTPNPFGYIITPTPVPVTMPDGPHILEVELNDRHIRAGGPLLVRVFTSTNVVGVEARALGRFIPIPQSSAGVFALVYTMPDGIPFWLLNRNYDVVIAAATADGRQTSVSFPMLLTR